MVAKSFKKREAAQTFEVGQRSFERLFPGFTEDSTKPALSAGQSGIGYNKSIDVARPYLGAVFATKPRILDMIRAAVTTELMPEQPLLARLDASFEAASAAFLGALDDSEKTTALQKAALAEETWQQTVRDSMAQQSRTQQLQMSNRRPTPQRTAQRTTAPSTTFPTV